MQQFSQRHSSLLIAAVAAGAFASPVQGQTDPANFTTVINVPPDVAPSFIGSSTQLNIASPAVIEGTLQAGERNGTNSDVEVNISGGTIRYLETFGSTINVSGGLVDQILSPRQSILNVSGGAVGAKFDFLALESGNELNLTGGTIRSQVVATTGVVRLSGGTVARRFAARGGSQVEILGGEFKLNGNEYASSSIDLGTDGLFTGTLADGSVFIFSPTADTLKNVSLLPATLPELETRPIIVDSSNRIGPNGLRPGQSLTLKNRGILPENFAVVDARLHVEGGLVRDGMEIARSTVNLKGGLVGNFSAYAGSKVNIGQTRVMGVVDIYDSVLNFSGETISGFFTARAGSEINISGGRLTRFVARADSVVNVTGGDVGPIDALDESEINLFGTEFYLDGTLLDSLVPHQPFAVTDRKRVLSGLFTDGTPFSFDLNIRNPGGGTYFSLDSSLTVTLVPPVPEPNAILLLAAGSFMLVPRRQRKRRQLKLLSSLSEHMYTIR